MKVLVDTCVWSLALRRQAQKENVVLIERLKDLISEHRVEIIGPIRQELLSGIKNSIQFVKLANYLEAFPDILCSTDDYVRAAQAFNALRKNGIQASHIDALICAMAIQHKLEIMTIDEDFKLYAKVLPVKLY